MVGLTILLHDPLPLPVTVPPLLNVKVHPPLAVIVPLIVVLLPLHILVAALVIAATGRALTVTTSDPVRSPLIEVQAASTNEDIVYVVVVVGLTLLLQVPLPLPVTVPPLLNVNVHEPVAVIVPLIVVLPPLQILVAALVTAATGRVFTVTTSDPVRSPLIEVQAASTNDAIVYVVVVVGLTLLLHDPLPLPVTVPPLLNVNVQEPVAVIVPLTVVLPPLQIVVAVLVIAATGRVFTVTTSDPVRSPLIEAQAASTNEAIVYVVVVVGLTLLLQEPVPVPVTVPPLLNVKVQAPVAVIGPLIFVLAPLQMVVAELVTPAIGRAFTVTTSDPVRSPLIEVQAPSTKEAIVYVVVVVGLTLLLQDPLPLPVTVPPLLNVNVQAPVAVIVPLIVVLPPLHIVVAVLVNAATGRVFTVTTSDPVRSPLIEVQAASANDAIVYVVVVDGLTLLLHDPLPLPVTVPPLLNVKVHPPLAVIVPLIVVLPPLHIVVAVLVIAATGRELTVTTSDPVRSPLMDVQTASVKEDIVYVVIVVGLTLLLHDPLPLPVTVPPLLNVKVQAPVAVIEPLIVVLPPLQMDVAVLVTAATGRGFIVTPVLPSVPQQDPVEDTALK